MSDEKAQRNARVERRYDDLMTTGKHGHYETMFRVVREEIEGATIALLAERDHYKAALEWIAAKPDEGNEWDGVDKFHECRDHARDALVTPSDMGRERPTA